MMTSPPLIRNIRASEYTELGDLMIKVYSQLDGFPSPEEQPAYYDMLANIGRMSEERDTDVLVALSSSGRLLGGVVYFSDMACYGSGGTATQETNASGIRLLGVSPLARGKGVGRALTEACLDRARGFDHEQVVLHTTQAMDIAWRLYLNMGFVRSEDLDFLQEDLPVFGFRLRLT